MSRRRIVLLLVEGESDATLLISYDAHHDGVFVGRESVASVVSPHLLLG